MLKLATAEDLSAILRLCGGDLLGTRIVCRCLAYGFQRDFLTVWLSETDGETDTVIAKFYDNVTVVTISQHYDEIKDFISMIGYRSLEMYSQTCEKLGFNADAVKKAYVFSGEAENFGAEDLSEEYYKSLYSLVSKNIPGSFSDSNEAYLSFLSDFTFRKSRLLARSKGFIEGNKLVSSVITSAETHNSALLSAVATDGSVRGKGYGKKTVLSVTDELLSENKKVFVIALNESAESFYEHIGFDFYGKIAFINEMQ